MWRPVCHSTLTERTATDRPKIRMKQVSHYTILSLRRRCHNYTGYCQGRRNDFGIRGGGQKICAHFFITLIFQKDTILFVCDFQCPPLIPKTIIKWYTLPFCLRMHWGRSLTVQPEFLKCRVLCGTVYGVLDYKVLLGSIARVRNCIPVPDLYLVLINQPKAGRFN